MEAREKSRLSSSRNSSEPPAPWGAARAVSCDFTLKSDKATARAPVGSDSRRVPKAGHSQKGALQTQSAEDSSSPTGTLKTHIPSTAFDRLAPSTFDPPPEHSTGKVVLFWQPPSYFSQWSPSSLVVDDVSYSCAEMYMMAEKARRFEDHRAVELITSSSGPSTYERVGQGVRNFNSAVWDREKQDAVPAGTYAKFTQNPTMELHLLLCPGRNTRPSLVGSAVPPGMMESTISRPLRSRARGPRSALAKALLRRFRPIFRAHRPTKVRRFWR